MCTCCNRNKIYLDNLCAMCAAPWWGIWKLEYIEDLCPNCFKEDQKVE